MVHKKSEYKLQYNYVPKELRKQIWEDNINLRCKRRSSNQAHHYWEFQITDDKCECDCADDEDGRQNTKVKHESLIDKFEKQNGPSSSEGKINRKLETEEEKCREMGSQTPEWTSDQTDSKLRKSSEELLRNLSSPSLQTTKETLSRPASPLPPRSPKQQRPHTSLSSVTRPSRTTRKLHAEGKKTHFVPYGWNEEHTEVGKKKTYNVCAPEKQVHEVAILASKRRNASVEKFLVQKVEEKRHLFKKSTDVTANHSSIWMSEYQEQYSKRAQTKIRPSSAPPASRHSSSWRYS